MTRKETAALIMLMREYYPRELTATSISTKVTAWELVLKDLSFELASQALIAFTSNDTKGFPPSPGQIIASANRLTEHGNRMTELEAWGFVSRAIKNSLYNASEEFEKLPELVQSVVHSPAVLRQWSVMDEATVESVIQSNFMRSYRAKEQSYQEWRNIPEGIRALASGVKLGALPSEQVTDDSYLNGKRNEMYQLLRSYCPKEV